MPGPAIKGGKLERRKMPMRSGITRRWLRGNLLLTVLLLVLVE